MCVLVFEDPGSCIQEMDKPYNTWAEETNDNSITNDEC